MNRFKSIGSIVYHVDKTVQPCVYIHEGPFNKTIIRIIKQKKTENDFQLNVCGKIINFRLRKETRNENSYPVASCDLSGKECAIQSIHNNFLELFGSSVQYHWKQNLNQKEEYYIPVIPQFQNASFSIEMYLKCGFADMKNLENFFSSSPVFKAIRMNATSSKEQFNPESKFYQTESIESQQRKHTFPDLLRNFQGKQAFIRCGTCGELDLIEFVNNWKSGKAFQKLEYLQIRRSWQDVSQTQVLNGIGSKYIDASKQPPTHSVPKLFRCYVSDQNTYPIISHSYVVRESDNRVASVLIQERTFFFGLHLFLHTQHACHRLPYLHCNQCSAVSQTQDIQVMVPHYGQEDPIIQKTPVLEESQEVQAQSPLDIQKTSTSEEAPKVGKMFPNDCQKTSPIEKLPAVDINQSKNCSKCLRTSEMCNEAKKELKMTQNKLEKHEKKAKRTDEVEKELKALKLEMKKKEKAVESRESDLQNKQKIIEQQESKLLKMEANETKTRLNEKNHSIIQNDLLEKITKLSDQSKAEKERIYELTAQLKSEKERMELQIQQNEERLNSEIRQKERGFEELRAALRIMSNEKESIQRENRNLRERIASVPEVPPTPPVPESLPEGPTHHRFALLGFQRIKDSLYNKKQLKQAKEMIEKLKSSSDLVEIHQIAEYEYYQFEWNLLKYTKEVELNIQRIKETRDVSMVTPLPDSPEFMNLYWRIINNQSITSSEIEVSDSECFICYVEMTSDQKTLQCEECKKVTHYECASKWLKIHRSCPHCRREMLDPEEFPNLGQ
ncbi:unnamed protein product [Caenorhabditis nigoni]